MSDSKSVVPKSPMQVMIDALLQNYPNIVEEAIDAAEIAFCILEAFEAHDIDVTWRPAEKAHGTLGGDE